MSHGIIYRNSCPHTHKQNGVAERKYHHIIENGLTLLAKASMPLKYRDEAFRAVVFLYSKLPTLVSHSKTHLEVLFHSSPNHSMLRVFGCACYPNTRPYTCINSIFDQLNVLFLVTA